ncbi:hypothetical protein [Actinomadura macrotermitis]|uniref:Uncharacterized protein n=1 Tax=Actinomadura macrotermitis TaxID=2585200 RepID=A0A7K0C0P6_9ACTN|nr:hypothetical protein [Actinomadura macrotermitis]MQY07043.1 hypothetical protein [Actinomadura macrotermitis]
MNRLRHLPGLAGAALGLLVLGPALLPGFVLTYDMVFVPDPVLAPATFGLGAGFPRQVPSDAVVALASAVAPAWLVQKALLLAVFVIGGAGAARLVPSRQPMPRLAAAVFYVWNPYIAERLLLGHWALLLGYAGLPWVVRATLKAAEPHGTRRLVRALIPAAIGGFAAMGLSALVAAAALAVSGDRRRAALRVVPVFAALALPFVVPALLFAGGRGGATDPAGVDLFAARADGPFGAFGSLLSLGGIWNGEVVPPGYGTWFGATGLLLLSLTSMAAFAVAARRADGSLRALAVAAVAGLLIASLGVTAPGRDLLRGLVGLWPGFGALRDGQVYIAPLALLQAVGWGCLVGFLAGARADAGRLALGAVVLVVPIALSAGLAWGIGGRLDAVSYPRGWAEARDVMRRDDVAGRVLSLPWGSHRRFPWNGGRASFDPLPLMVDRPVVWNDGLRVIVGGREVALAQENPAARAADAALRSGAPLAGWLRDHGYRYVVVAATSADDPAIEPRLAGLAKVAGTPELTLWRVDGPKGTETSPGTTGPAVPMVALGDLIAVMLVIWALVTYVAGRLESPHPPGGNTDAHPHRRDRRSTGRDHRVRDGGQRG